MSVTPSESNVLIELLAGLFGGFGAVVVWEGIIKRLAVRRQVARVLSAEIRQHVEYLEEIQAIRERDPLTRPVSWPSTHPGYQAVGLTIGELPTELVLGIMNFYRDLDTVAAGIADMAKEAKLDTGFLADVDRNCASAISDGHAILPRLEKIAFGWRRPKHLDVESRKAEIIRKADEAVARIATRVRDHR